MNIQSVFFGTSKKDLAGKLFFTSRGIVLCMAQSDKNPVGDGMSSFRVPESRNSLGLRLAGTRQVRIHPDCDLPEPGKSEFTRIVTCRNPAS
jgi:hypothetical protein